MKTGKVMLIFIALGYLVTIIYILVNGINPEKKFFGATSLSMIEDFNEGKKINLYIDLSARNALYLAALDINNQGPFDASCAKIDDQLPVLSDQSCVLTQTLLHKRYLQFFQTHFRELLQYYPPTTFLAEENSYEYTLTQKKDILELVGKSKKQLPFTGDSLSYTINPSFRESISYPLESYLRISNQAIQQLSCFQTEKTNAANFCPLDVAYIWATEQKKDYLSVTVKKKEFPSHPLNIAFSFAINLNTASQTPSSLFT